MTIDALTGVAAIGEWQVDEDYRIHPYGSKAKRTLICSEAVVPSLIPQHRGLFKRAEGWLHEGRRARARHAVLHEEGVRVLEQNPITLVHTRWQ